LCVRGCMADAEIEGTRRCVTAISTRGDVEDYAAGLEGCAGQEVKDMQDNCRPAAPEVIAESQGGGERMQGEEIAVLGAIPHDVEALMPPWTLQLREVCAGLHKTSARSRGPGLRPTAGRGGGAQATLAAPKCAGRLSIRRCRPRQARARGRGPRRSPFCRRAAGREPSCLKPFAPLSRQFVAAVSAVKVGEGASRRLRSPPAPNARAPARSRPTAAPGRGGRADSPEWMPKARAGCRRSRLRALDTDAHIAETWILLHTCDGLRGSGNRSTNAQPQGFPERPLGAVRHLGA